MPDPVTTIRARIEDRLKELETEREALTRALDALSDVPAATPKRISSPASPARRPRARRGENLEKILPLITADPGLPPRDIAAATGIDARTVAATLSKLRRDGRLSS